MADFLVILRNFCASAVRFLFCCCSSYNLSLFDASSSFWYLCTAYQFLIWASCLNFWKSFTSVLFFKTQLVF